ncbi:hypothetical protein DL96DRAFT_1685539 [Flagelloscypha sp. PMI_526]|nr:hypothetical protein DL96DRAFT_1685539 [Flagelloscypha sp. PMI_526]
MTMEVPSGEEGTTLVPKRHDEFYFDDTFIIFQVENILFRVRLGYFKESPIFQDMLSLQPPISEEMEGRSDNHPIILAGEKADEFAFFLSLLRNVYDFGRRPRGSKQDWLSALRIAHKYLMLQTVKSLALSALSTPKLFEATEKLQLCDELGLEVSWAADAVMSLLQHFASFKDGYPVKERLELRRAFTPKTWETVMWCRDKHFLRRMNYYGGEVLTVDLVKEWLQSLEKDGGEQTSDGGEEKSG